MLTDEEINECLNDHRFFVNKYIDPSVYVCCNLIDHRGIERPQIYSGFNGGFQCFLDCLKGQIVPNRDLFFEVIGESGKFEKCLEIGVADGQNSQRIIDNIDLQKIWLIDPWKEQDKRGADRGKDQEEHSAAETATRERFKTHIQKGKVEILKGFAKDKIDLFPDEFFDLIYVDGDHSYEGCKNDLYAWYPKLKKGGVFAGHDFTNNYRSMSVKKFGVQKAVTEFLLDHGAKLQIITPCIETAFPYTLLPFDWGFRK
jgi:hypothetical protein